MRGRQAAEGVRPDEGDVAAQHQDGPVCLHGVGQAAQCVAGAEGLLLLDDIGSVTQGGPHLWLAGVDDHHGPGAGHSPGSVENMEDQRTAAEWMEHLRSGALHPFSLPGGENDRQGTVSHVARVYGVPEMAPEIRSKD